TLTAPVELRQDAQRALDTLDRLDARLEPHYGPRRRHHRRPFRAAATVRRPLVPPPGPQEVTVWTREISESGLSFIHKDRIAEDWVLVGLEPQPGRTVWLRADVVRRREVPTGGFWEHAVAFRGRIEE
ncbi:MAG TPA: PilZ domain-containing protein, partial [Planctomycetaceae bacterium]